MIIKLLVVVKELFAKITIRMRQYFTIFIVSHVTIFDVLPQGFNMVESLLPYKNTSTFQANFAECFFMLLNEMAL